MPGVRSFLCFVAIIFAGVCAASTVWAEDRGLGFSAKHKEYLDLVFFDPSDIYLLYTYQPKYSSQGQSQETDLNSLYFEADGGAEIGDDTLFFIDLEYTFRRYNFGPSISGASSPGAVRLHQLASLMGFAHFFTENLVGLWSFYPGISSDFTSGLEARNLDWSSGPVAAYRFSPRFAVHGGVQVSADYYEADVFPIGGISYFSPDRMWHVNVTAPFLYRVGRRVTEDLEFYGSVWYSRSSSYARLGSSRVPSFIEIGDVQGGVGALWSFSRHLTLTVEAGMSVGQRFHVKEGFEEGNREGSETIPYMAMAWGWRF